MTTSRSSPYPAIPTTADSAKPTTMAASTYMHPPQQSFRSSSVSQAPFPLSIPATHSFERDSKTVRAPFNHASPVSVLIRGLSKDATEEQVRLMLMFSAESPEIQLLPEVEDMSRSAILTFKTAAGADGAKNGLDGKSNLSVKILNDLPGDSTNRSSTSSSATSSVHSSRQPSRFNGALPPVGKMSPPTNGALPPVGRRSPPTNGAYGSELPTPEDTARYQNIFSPQSPIGNHLNEHTRISGKSLIKRDTDDDDETGELLKDPLAYAEQGTMLSQRRATAPHIPITQFTNLSLNTAAVAAPGPSSLPPPGHPNMVPGHSSAMSPTAMNGGAGHGVHYPKVGHFGRHNNFPPVNPADQNPPCNTLYVGNLPVDTSEEELKAMFSKQRGYKRLCFRTKQNGPMCFVEFEDVTFATKALNELYGHPLHNSIKGGIRLSFSKNPLGVRSGQTNGQPPASSMAPGMMASSAGGFTTASGPPPGLSAPPGLGSGRYSVPSGSPAYTPAGFSAGSNTGNPWNSYNGSASSGAQNSMMNGNGSAGYVAPHMLGR